MATTGSAAAAGKFDASVFTPLDWDPELYGVGVRSIDEQHQQLIGFIDKLCQLGRIVNSPAAAAANANANATVGSAGGGRGGGAAASPSKPAAAVGSSSVSPMGMHGALGLDMHRGAARSGGSDSDDHDHDDHQGRAAGKGSAAAAAGTATIGRGLQLREPVSAAERSRGAHGGGGAAAGDAAGQHGDSSRPAASQAHIHPVRVSATGCAKFVDRGHPPELQLGGQIEPLIDGLIFHANVRLIQEEHNLEAVSFADRGSHAQEHQIFVREVFRAFRLMESCNMEMGDLVALIRFLKAWCNTHIPKDRRFAPLMLEKTKG